MSEYEERRQAYIDKVVAEAPPLSVEQRHRLASLLRPMAEKLRREATEQDQTPDEEHTE